MRAEAIASLDGMPALDGRGYVQRRVRRLAGRDSCERDECIAEECAVALVYNGEPHAVMMATPRDLDDFALGFTLSERVVDRPSELLGTEIRELEQGLQISMHIPEIRHRRLLDRPRGLEGRSGCGICGTRTIGDALRPPRRVTAGIVIEHAALRRALTELRERQPLNAATGAIHAAAWASPDGAVQWLREDVGRHNALDKLIGALSAAGVNAAQGFAVLTSRASYEMVMKSANAGIPIVAAISAPTSLAIELADDAGLTLAGFARDERCTVYTRTARIRAGVLDAPATAADGPHEH